VSTAVCPVLELLSEQMWFNYRQLLLVVATAEITNTNDKTCTNIFTSIVVFCHFQLELFTLCAIDCSKLQYILCLAVYCIYCWSLQF